VTARTVVRLPIRSPISQRFEQSLVCRVRADEKPHYLARLRAHAYPAIRRCDPDDFTCGLRQGPGTRHDRLQRSLRQLPQFCDRIFQQLDHRMVPPEYRGCTATRSLDMKHMAARDSHQQLWTVAGRVIETRAEDLDPVVGVSTRVCKRPPLEFTEQHVIASGSRCQAEAGVWHAALSKRFTRASWRSRGAPGRLALKWQRAPHEGPEACAD
jgi:hypothetical protein